MNKLQQKLTHYCYDLLARRRYSIHEMVTKLEAKNHRSAEQCTDQELQEILAALVKANLLNDRDYAGFYLDSQMRRKPVGKAKIRQQLRAKGIEESIISQTLNRTEVDELKMARELIKKKAKLYSEQQLADQKIQARLMRYLATNGFRGEICFKVLKELGRTPSFHPDIF